MRTIARAYRYRPSSAACRIFANIRRRLDGACQIGSLAGWPFTIHNLRQRYYKINKPATGVKIPPHDGRHTFASVPSGSGMPAERIAPLTGHKHSRVSEAVYTHLMRPVLNDAADAIDDAFDDE